MFYGCILNRKMTNNIISTAGNIGIENRDPSVTPATLSTRHVSDLVVARVRSHRARAPCGQRQPRLVCHHPVFSRPTYQLEDRCRDEHFPQLARQLSEKKGQLPPQWSGCSSLRRRTSVAGIAKFAIQLWVSWLVLISKVPFDAWSRIRSRRRRPSPGSISADSNQT